MLSGLKSTRVLGSSMLLLYSETLLRLLRRSITNRLLRALGEDEPISADAGEAGRPGADGLCSQCRRSRGRSTPRSRRP